MRRRLLVGILAVAGLGLGAGLATLSPPKRTDPITVHFSVEPGQGLREIAAELQALRVVRSATAFTTLAVLRGQADELQAGPYRASSDEWAWSILGRLARGDVRDTTVTIPEGLWLPEVAAAVDGVVAGGRDAFLAAAGDSALLAEFGIPADSAEGYLFPETYRVPPGIEARRLVRRMLTTFAGHWEGRLAARADTVGMTRHEVVTLASIVEAEAQVDGERPRIAAVYRNRLAADHPLQADPTVVYGLGERRARVFYDDLESPSPYNTYRVVGLPPGPIGNPGLRSLEAALWPEPGCRDFYFVARGDGTHAFSRTYEEHLRERRRLESERRADGKDSRP